MPFQTGVETFARSHRPATTAPPDLNLVRRQQAQSFIGYTSSDSSCLSQESYIIISNVANCISQGYPSLAAHHTPSWKPSHSDRVYPDMLAVAWELVFLQQAVPIT
jgi:hypothetical protein